MFSDTKNNNADSSLCEYRWFGDQIRNKVKNILTFTGLASVRILPQDTASSGRAPESEPSNSWPVFTYTEYSAPFLWREGRQHQGSDFTSAFLKQPKL